jgi:predicted porin
MNKKIIALAIATLPSLALADSGVTIYGKIAGNVSSVQTIGTDGSAVRNTVVNDNTSNIGFKGTEDLGNGSNVIWQVENRIHVDGSGTDTFGSRDTFVGFQNQYGKLRIGFLSDYANLDMEYTDPGSYTRVAGQYYSTRLDGRIKNAIRYDSPDLAGFSFTTVWGADETRTADSAGNPTNNQIVDIGLSYTNSGYFGKLNYETRGDAKGVNSSQQSGSVSKWWRLEAGYIVNPIYLVVAYQSVNGYLGVSSGSYADTAGVAYNITALNARLKASGLTANANQEAKTREAVLTLGYNIGAFLPYIELAKGYNLNIGGSDLANSGYKQYVVGVNYSLSKTSTIKAAYGYANWGGNGVANESSLGLALVKSF